VPRKKAGVGVGYGTQDWPETAPRSPGRGAKVRESCRGKGGSGSNNASSAEEKKLQAVAFRGSLSDPVTSGGNVPIPRGASVVRVAAKAEHGGSMKSSDFAGARRV